MPNIKKVAEEANVSTATVSRVINGSGYATEEVKKRVWDAVKRLNYRPSAIARSLKQNKTNTIGVIIPDITNPYFMKIAKGLEEKLYEGCQLLFVSSDENEEKEARLLTMMLEKRVDAILLAPSQSEVESIVNIARSGTPVIIVDRRIKQDEIQLDHFVEENVHISKEVTTQLLVHGHEHIGFIHGGEQISTSAERLQGIREALREHGVNEENEYFFDGRYTEQGGKDAVEYFLSLKTPPSAIFALNNKMSFGALVELNHRNINIPGHIRFASFGELEAAKLLPDPEIIYVQQKPYEMGVAIGERIAEIAEIQGDSSGEYLKVNKIFAPIIKIYH